MRHKDATFAYVFMPTRDSHGCTGGYLAPGASAERLWRDLSDKRPSPEVRWYIPSSPPCSHLLTLVYSVYIMAVVGATRATTKTVVVLGAAYAGRRCAQILSSTLPPDWRLVVIDRNTHFNRGSLIHIAGLVLMDRCLCLPSIHGNPISRQQGFRTVYTRIRAPPRRSRLWSPHSTNDPNIRVSSAQIETESVDSRERLFPRLSLGDVYPTLKRQFRPYRWRGRNNRF
jgi:hypothetical protein